MNSISDISNSFNYGAAGQLFASSARNADVKEKKLHVVAREVSAHLNYVYLDHIEAGVLSKFCADREGIITTRIAIPNSHVAYIDLPRRRGPIKVEELNAESFIKRIDFCLLDNYLWDSRGTSADEGKRPTTTTLLYRKIADIFENRKDVSFFIDNDDIMCRIADQNSMILATDTKEAVCKVDRLFYHYKLPDSKGNAFDSGKHLGGPKSAGDQKE